MHMKSEYEIYSYAVWTIAPEGSDLERGILVGRRSESARSALVADRLLVAEGPLLGLEELSAPACAE